MSKSQKKSSNKRSRKSTAKLLELKKVPKKPSTQATGAANLVHTGDASAEPTALARITQLETDRTNLMAQVAWARGVAQEQQKALQAERQRAEKLAADVEAQRARVEELKALSILDRLLGRHKRI